MIQGLIIYEDIRISWEIPRVLEALCQELWTKTRQILSYKHWPRPCLWSSFPYNKTINPWSSLEAQEVKDLTLSLLWRRFADSQIRRSIPGLGISACCRCSQTNKQTKANQPYLSIYIWCNIYTTYRQYSNKNMHNVWRSQYGIGGF